MPEVDSQQLPRGRSFIDFALGKTLEHAQNGRKDEQVVTWARNQIAENGAPYSMLGRAEIIYRKFCERVSYVEDPYDVELIAKPRDVMCLPGADLCMKAADCEEHAAALCACFSAVGLQTAMIHQLFETSNHAIAGVYVEDGWLRADSSYYKKLGGKLGSHFVAKQERWFDTMTGTLLHTGDGKTLPNGTLPDRVLLGKKPLHDFVSISGIGALGAAAETTPDQVVGAWSNWLAGAEKAMMASFSRASAAIQQLQKFRDGTGLPQYDAEGSDGWTPTVAKVFYGALSTAVKDLERYATEALDGKREVVWVTDGTTGSLGIVAKPGDETSYGVGAGDTIITNGLASQPGGLGVAPLVVVAVAGSVAVYSVAVYLTVSKLCDTYSTHVAAQHQKDMAAATQRYLAGGATPEQAVALVKAITGSAPMAAPPKTNELVDIFKTLVTGVAIVAGLGIVYIVAERIIEYKGMKKAA